jgi:membrane protein implicated in regulation of membrane protease activity
MLRAEMYWQGALAIVLAVAAFVLLARLVRSTPLPSRLD